MILVINVCKENLHYYEFVKPIEDLLKKEQKQYTTKKYTQIKNKDIGKAKKIIICGTSLKDFEFYNNLEKFEWIKKSKKPLLGICAGAQIIAKAFDATLKDSLHVGLEKINISKEFLKVKGDLQAYYLHQIGISRIGKNLERLSNENHKNSVLKHKTRPIYATLFHPEVRNKKVISNFIKNG